MNTFLLVARHLGTVSGEKIYHYNKLKFMLSKGWRVMFFSNKEENIPIEKSPHFFQYIFPALEYAPECYSRQEVTETVNGIVNVVGDTGSGRCIIESDSVNRAAWAELIAKRLGAKHFAFLLQETHPYDEEARKFLKYKYNRHELAGITEQSIKHILCDENIEVRDDTRFAAFCNNVVEECEDTVSGQLFKSVRYTFGSLGRLDKKCVPAILKGFKEYAAAHHEDKFNLVLIGGATGKKRLQEIRKEMKGCENIHLIITGYMYPIPVSLLQNIDLFVSTAGSSRVTYRFHRPTIRVHPVTGEPVGILGLDNLQGKTMYDTISDMTVADCIEKTLKNVDKIKYSFNRYEDYYQKMFAEFNRQLSFSDIVIQKDYYDEELLMHITTSHIKWHSMHKIVGHIAGANGLNKIIGLYKRLMKV